MFGTLMHGGTEVAQIELHEEYGFILRAGAPLSPAHLPLGVPARGEVIDRTELNEWWTERGIPTTREGIREALSNLRLPGASAPLTRSLGLSLTDAYWFRPEGSHLRWEEVNFFYNDFSPDVGDALFFGRSSEKPDYASPDWSSDGSLRKRWIIADGKRLLMKAGSRPFRQQPANEVIAAGIARRLGIPHADYTLAWEGNEPVCLCEDFAARDTELVPAYRIVKTKKRQNSESVYRHFLDRCDSLGIEGATDFLDRMIVLDYIIANEDRHFYNFGVLRDPVTLAWRGFAPIYDSGSSLGYSSTLAQITGRAPVDCKPFRPRHEEQLSLVQDLSWFRADALSDVRELIEDTLAHLGEFADPSRSAAIAKAAAARVERVSSLARQQREKNHRTQGRHI